MKTTRTFKGSLFLLAIVTAIALGEVVAWKLSELSGVRINPLTVAFLGVGIVALITSFLYDGVDIG